VKKKQRQYHDLDYKRRMVAEYLNGNISADDLAKREGLIRGQIYKWRSQLDQRQRLERVEVIADTEGVTLEQARRIRDLEEELLATQQKLAQTVLENELLKKLQPNSPYASGSSGYIDMKRQLARSKGRAV
jgi:transposase-like protein